VGFILAAILTVIGTLLLLASLAGVAFGVYMAADPKTRESGKLFAVWWVPAAAAASGLFMRDVVTFTIGALCFLVAGAVFTFEDGKARTPTAKRTNEKREDSEKTTKENRKTDDEASS
jgi:phosphotransferase system  glucose/maltose/N-acetylglucosamine-specific IIC component